LGYQRSVYEARIYLELLEAEFARGEYPPFDRWYRESWIRSTFSNNNRHRAYNQLRDFIWKEGIGSLPLPPPSGGPAPGPGRGTVTLLTPRCQEPCPTLAA
jgi:hypothetical protein